MQQLLPGFAGAAVLDADGLNAAAQLLAEGKPFPHPAGELVVTPHPGEMARLCGCSIADIKARYVLATSFPITNYGILSMMGFLNGAN